ncbi:MAG: hypothetical protein GKR95_02155 [Gammaproteobacteria bacterium]|nr:hypothetical protein [Gammaproteobacteria bacterium]
MSESKKDSPPDIDKQVQEGLIDICDELAKLNKQAKAVTTSLLCDDHVKCLNDSIITNLVWTVDDHLRKMKSLQDDYWELIGSLIGSRVLQKSPEEILKALPYKLTNG